MSGGTVSRMKIEVAVIAGLVSLAGYVGWVSPEGHRQPTTSPPVEHLALSTGECFEMSTSILGGYHPHGHVPEDLEYRTCLRSGDAMVCTMAIPTMPTWRERTERYHRDSSTYVEERGRIRIGFDAATETYLLAETYPSSVLMLTRHCKGSVGLTP